MKKVLCIIIIGAVIYSYPALAASASGAIRRGNKLYKQEEFEQALKEYEKAREALPESDIVNFDLGTAYYKKGKFPEAIDSFAKSLATEDVTLETKTNYNIGNAKYKQAEQIEDSNLEGAISLLKESLDYYQMAAELDKEDDDAKANYEFVQKKIEELEAKLQQQQSQEGEQQEEGEETKDEGRGMKDEGGSEEETKDEGRGMKDEEGREEEEKGEGEQGGEEKDKQGVKEEIGQMSKEQALLLLEGYRQEEESGDKKINFQKKMDYPGVLKDW
ncbi:MAG: tetratricopeptide repeat protein [Candidatus Omnitrophota bacterium]